MCNAPTDRERERGEHWQKAIYDWLKSGSYVRNAFFGNTSAFRTTKAENEHSVESARGEMAIIHLYTHVQAHMYRIWNIEM